MKLPLLGHVRDGFGTLVNHHRLEQALGWEPDISDCVRLNIRLFYLARDMGRKGSDLLHVRPKSIRGNDLPYTCVAKDSARAAARPGALS